jgi:hypothetical protein
MSDNTELPTRAHKEQANDYSEAPVVSGPNNSEVKEINAVGDSHPLVEETGSDALETQTESGAGEFLSDFIYEHDSAWVREWLQNHETACVRAAKLLIGLSDEYSDDWLTLSMWVDDETGETVIPHDSDQSPLADFEEDPTELRQIDIPRPIDQVLEAARSLGYDPTIVWDVYRDERQITTEDNGIGMTPREFDTAFNTIFSSGSGVDGETGGMFGVGSESSALVHGKDGGAEVETRSRRPGDHDGFRAYSYLGGANALPGEVEDGFYGTRFHLPVQGSFSLSNVQGWIEDYAEKLRVPLLYREHDAGTTPVEEEYEATSFTDDYNDPPITIDRPGEFSVVAGPNTVDTGYHSDDEDTFLVSMPIDRNSGTNIRTLWEVAIQIHDEQGRIVMGPNRGRYSDGTKVYETSEKAEAIGKLQDEDVMLPEPTGDRDRLQKDSEAKQFFNYIQDIVTDREMDQVTDILLEMKRADHPGTLLQDSKGEWDLFREMIEYHGPYSVTERSTKFETYMNDEFGHLGLDDDTLSKMFRLFGEVSHCGRGPGYSKKKRRRTEMKLGKFLSKGHDTVYMAASTGGKFTQRFKVAKNTDSNATVVVVSSASNYGPYERHFGFSKLKDVPLKQDDDHDYEVPDNIHEKNKTVKKEDSGPDSFDERELKIRTDGDNSSIDARRTIETVQEKMESGGLIHGHPRLVLFGRGSGPNISDHYDLADQVAIASATKKEREALSEYDKVMSFEEYKEWSRSALIATEEGAKTPQELHDDDRMVIIAYRGQYLKNNSAVKLLREDREKLRQLYVEDIRDQVNWNRLLDGYEDSYNADPVDDSDKPGVLFGVAGRKVLRRAEWAFGDLSVGEISRDNILGMKLGTDKFGYHRPFRWQTLDGEKVKYKWMADTPNWDDSSQVYKRVPGDRKSMEAQIYLGLHDRNIDPTKTDNDELREIVGK